MNPIRSELAPKRTVVLPDGREVDVRDSGDPSNGAASVPLVLVHGWLATADLNWGFAYPSLVDKFRVIAFDQPGHGRGVTSHRRFTFDHCADDLALVLDALAIDDAIVVGYSMGGPIALTFAKNYESRTAGIVLCATAGAFTSSPLKRSLFRLAQPVADATRIIPNSPIRRAARQRFISRRASGRHADWIAAELTPSDLTGMLQAGVAIARFDALSWLNSLKVPSACVITVDDALVSPQAQRALCRGLAQSKSFDVTGGHTTCFDHPDRFVPVLGDACEWVTSLR